MTFKDRFLNWLFTALFGKLDIKAEIRTTERHILVAEIVAKTRFGDFTFPILNKQLPIPAVGEVATLAAVPASDESEDTRPA